MSLSPTTTPEPRAKAPPQRRALQARGRERVAVILKAAAELIVSDGLPRLTMHGVALRSGTSIGSMYHFFPTIESVLEALVETHRDALLEMGTALTAIDDAQWTAMSTLEVVDRLVGPFLGYLHRRRDALIIVTVGQWREIDDGFRELLRHVLALRLGPGRDEALTVAALTVHAVTAGSVQMAAQLDEPLQSACLAEIPTVLTAYLESLDAALAPPAELTTRQHR